MKILVTGSAGFIGFHLTRRLALAGHEVLGFDGMTPYYDVRLKARRHQLLAELPGCRLVEGLLEDQAALGEAVTSFAPEVIVHLAAQAGVRYSLEHPETYIASNIVGTFNLLELARRLQPKHLLLASTSSVYGGNVEMPFREPDATDSPMSLYAATKKSCEAMSHSYAHLFGIPTTCFRFFTVYGPWGRPDMALFKFVTAIEEGQPIDIYGHGDMRRDFTYIDDLVESVARLIDVPPVKGQPVEGGTDSLSPVAPWRTVNIGGGQPVQLLDFVAAVESALGREATKRMLPMQPGDVVSTFADPSLLKALTGYQPSTDYAQGVAEFVRWYRAYRNPSAS